MISLSNTQFQRFVDFASAQPDAAKSKTVATIDAGPAEPGAEPLAVRTITATAGDSVGKMFRRQSAIDANNRVRDLFKEAVADISDVENYDITIDAKTGDVTIKLTHYEDSRFTQYFDDKYQATVFTNAAKETAKMAEAKFVVTLKQERDGRAARGQDALVRDNRLHPGGAVARRLCGRRGGRPPFHGK